MGRKRKKNDEEKVRVCFVEDKIEYTCPPNRIVKKLNGDVFMVKWIDGRSYAARIVEGLECIPPEIMAKKCVDYKKNDCDEKKNGKLLDTEDSSIKPKKRIRRSRQSVSPVVVHSEKNESEMAETNCALAESNNSDEMKKDDSKTTNDTTLSSGEPPSPNTDEEMIANNCVLAESNNHNEKKSDCKPSDAVLSSEEPCLPLSSNIDEDTNEENEVVFDDWNKKKKKSLLHAEDTLRKPKTSIRLCSRKSTLPVNVGRKRKKSEMIAEKKIDGSLNAEDSFEKFKRRIRRCARKSSSTMNVDSKKNESAKKKDDLLNAEDSVENPKKRVGMRIRKSALPINVASEENESDESSCSELSEPSVLQESSDEYTPEKNRRNSSSSESSSSNDEYSNQEISAGEYQRDDPQEEAASLEKSENPDAPDSSLYAITVNKNHKNEPSRVSKRYCCLICKKLVAKLPRHLADLHSKDPDVMEYIQLQGEAKRAKLEKMRAEGNALHNRSVRIKMSGLLLTKRVISYDSNDANPNYQPCPACKVEYKTTYLYRHKIKCAARNPDFVFNKRIVQQAGIFANNVMGREVSDAFRAEVLGQMESDDVFKVIIGDELILAVGQDIFMTADCEPGKDRGNYISCKMRELGRFLMAMRQHIGSESRSLMSCLRPKEVSNIIEATKNVALYIEKENRFEIPSLAKKIGHLLHKAATIVSGRAAEDEEDDTHFRMLEKFIANLDSRWRSEISIPAQRTLRDRKFNAVAALPLAEDIRKLNIFLQNNIRLYLQKIESNTAQPHDLIELSRQTLCLIMCFNRRRAGEAANVKLKVVENHMKYGGASTEILETLTKLERKLITMFSRFETRGKRGRKVPILLTELMRRGVEAIAELPNRHLMGIMDENPYLFAIPGTQASKYKVHSVLPSYAENCGASNPSLLRSIKLRKHLATMTQVHNLNKNELDVVATFMGHDITVHREYYRLPESTIQLAKVGKLLSCVNKGIEMESVEKQEDLQFSESDTDSTDELEDNDDNELLEDVNDDNDDVQPAVDHSPPLPSVLRRRKPCIKKAWSAEETEQLKTAFKQFMGVDYLPPKKAIEKAQKQYALLGARKWSVIKDKIKYLQKKNA